MEAAASTPARAAAREEREGVLILADRHGTWAHGAESETGRVLRAARDRSDMSDELAALGSEWPASADVARERGHIVRPLRLSAEHRVLEVGAGCGAVTRHLGERCRLVDALELNPDRARLAALRLADLENARVLCGDVTDIPPEPAYDVIVVIGVLEYIGGHDRAQPRVEWLRALRALLRPGGHLVCAIENRLGVGYLAGGPDDHSGQLFQGIEDHPVDFPARTFARGELEALFTAAGLVPTTLGVLPDYRFPRMIFSDALLTGAARPLAWRVPPLPTPPHQSFQAARILDERRVWRGLVESGMGMEFANSFLVVAGRDAPQALWPGEQLAVWHTIGRRRALATQTRVTVDGPAIRVARERLAPEQPVPAPLTQRGGDAQYVAGEDFVDLLAAVPPAERRAWLRRFVAFARANATGEEAGVQFDLWPGNLVLQDGALVLVDTELRHAAMTVGEVIERALLLTAVVLPQRAVRLEAQAATVRDLVGELCDEADVPRFDVDAVIRGQAELMALVFADDPGTAAHEQRREREIEALVALLATPISELSIHTAGRDAGPGFRDRIRRAEHERAGLAVELERQVARADSAERELDALRERLAAAERTLAVIVDSRSWRVTKPLRAVAARRRQ